MTKSAHNVAQRVPSTQRARTQCSGRGRTDRHRPDDGPADLEDPRRQGATTRSGLLMTTPRSVWSRFGQPVERSSPRWCPGQPATPVRSSGSSAPWYQQHLIGVVLRLASALEGRPAGLGGRDGRASAPLVGIVLAEPTARSEEGEDGWGGSWLLVGGGPGRATSPRVARSRADPVPAAPQVVRLHRGLDHHLAHQFAHLTSPGHLPSGALRVLPYPTRRAAAQSAARKLGRLQSSDRRTSTPC